MAELSACRASLLAPVTPLISHTWHSRPMTALPHLNHVGRGALYPACLMSVPPGDGTCWSSPPIFSSYILPIIICTLEDVKPLKLHTLHFISLWYSGVTLCSSPEISVFDVFVSINLSCLCLLTNPREGLCTTLSVEKCKFCIESATVLDASVVYDCSCTTY